MSRSRAEGTFQVVSFTPVEIAPAAAIATAMDGGVATMEKQFSGQIAGRSATLFTGCRDDGSGAGAYVALEAFAGSLNGVAGAFNFVHAASTHGEDRYAEHFAIVDASGTDGLAGISGSGGLRVDPDGTHHLWFDYDLAPA